MAVNVRQFVTLVFVMTATVLIYKGLRVSRGVVVREPERVDIPDSGPRQVVEKSQRNGTLHYTKHQRKVVILLSNQRSGSSFVGDFFAHNSKAFYLFEPLHPYGMACDKLSDERLQFLQKISSCDFSSLVEDYKNAYASTGVRSHRECLRYHLCSVAKHKALLKRYSKLCYATLNYTNAKSGGPDLARRCVTNPIRLDLWSSLCRSSTIVAFKILRICSLQALQGVYENLSALGYKVHVIELVRDPRGIVSSALKLELKMSGLQDRLSTVCGKFERNMDYIETPLNETNSGIRRYMRVRFEDIADNPMRAAKKIYEFIEESIPEEVTSWLEMATGGPKQILDELRHKLNDGKLSVEERLRLQSKIAIVTKQGNNPYGTTRNSSNVPLKWRRALSMNTVEKIQDRCGEVMTRLGYKLVNDIEEKGNYSIKLY